MNYLLCLVVGWHNKQARSQTKLVWSHPHVVGAAQSEGCGVVDLMQ